MTHPVVLHFIPGLVTAGAEHMLTSAVTAKRAKPYGRAVVNLTVGSTYAAPIRAAGVPLYELGLTMMNWPAVIAHIRKLSPGVIRSWLYYSDVTTTLALCLSGRRRDTKLYWGVRGSDFSLDFSIRLRLAIASCVRLSQLPDAVIANSYAGRRNHQLIGYRPPAFAVIPNGIGCRIQTEQRGSRAHPRRARHCRGDALRLSRRAHQSDERSRRLSAGCRRRTEIRFAAIGRGTDALHGPPNMMQLGLRQEMPAIYAAADCLISTSRFGEGFSNVTAEAMASGVPAVVATDVGDAREISGDTGLVVPPGSAVAPVDALHRLLSEGAVRRRARRTLKEFGTMIPWRKRLRIFVRIFAIA